mgnify:CR=1 FL=1
MCPFNFRKENPFESIKFCLDEDELTVWAIPLKSKIKCFIGDRYEEIKVGESTTIEKGKSFTFYISFLDHTLIIEGRHIDNQWPLMIEWFDFTK